MSEVRLRRLLPGLLLVALPALAAGVPDPMRPPSGPDTVDAPSAAPQVLQLTSTLIADGRRVATINGHPYRVGDRVGDAKLVAIEPTAVVLERDAGRLRLELLPSRVKTRAGR